MDKTNSLTQFTQFLTKAVDKEEVTNEYLKNLSVFLRTKEHELNIASTKDALDISMNMLQESMQKKNLTFIDLKQYFAKSSKARKSKNGGWYLRVPLHPKVRDVRDVYGRSLWDNTISKMDFGDTFSSNFLNIQDKMNKGNVIKELQYQWKSNSITRQRLSSNSNRGTYLMFRTVSDKSDPLSWIVGRQNLSNEIQNNNSHNERQLASYVSQVISAYVENYNRQNM